MRIFHCSACDQLVFFENIRCLSCGRTLAFLPDVEELGAFDPAGEGLWQSPKHGEKTYRLCANYDRENVCNWAIPNDDPHELCASCRLTRVIPDLTIAGNKEHWYSLEVAKRRLIYSLLSLELPLQNRIDDPERGLCFEFLAEPNEDGAQPIFTGHAAGVITINIAEADDAERERRRMLLREPYRTVLGHFRHETGHYYWDRLIDGTPRQEPFREVFGDERTDYAAALQRHYDQGAAPDWPSRNISAYASMHPWEDWAETWAHYLHMVDMLETAASCGLSLRPPKPGDPTLVPDRRGRLPRTFDRMIDDWYPLTYVLNNLNRGMGLKDGYPFVLSDPVVEKLRFVHEATAGK